MRRLTIADVMVRGTLIVIFSLLALLWSTAVLVSFVWDMLS